MTYRVRRKLISTTFKINSTLCKLFIEPWGISQKNFWVWNVGFVIGKSNRQLNDWYTERRNKRARSITEKVTGKEGVTTITQGWKRVLKYRWLIPPGDTICLDCTSGDPDKQFRAWSFLKRHHHDWDVDEVKKEFYWTRPPYPRDPVWDTSIIIPRIPKDPLGSISDQDYFDCFDALPKDQHKAISRNQNNRE